MEYFCFPFWWSLSGNWFFKAFYRLLDFYRFEILFIKLNFDPVIRMVKGVRNFDTVWNIGCPAFLLLFYVQKCGCEVLFLLGLMIHKVNFFEFAFTNCLGSAKLIVKWGLSYIFISYEFLTIHWAKNIILRQFFE